MTLLENVPIHLQFLGTFEFLGTGGYSKRELTDLSLGHTKQGSGWIKNEDLKKGFYSSNLH